MILNRLDFKYSLKKDRFNHISYTFEVDATQDDIKHVIDNDFKTLEHILDKYVVRQGIKKEKNGEMSSDDIEFGYDYHCGIMRAIFGKAVFGHLRYQIGLFDDKVTSAELKLLHSDDNDKLLKVYDTILILPDLSMSKEAKKAKDKIDSLRQGPPDSPLYLDYT